MFVIMVHLTFRVVLMFYSCRMPLSSVILFIHVKYNSFAVTISTLLATVKVSSSTKI